MNSLCSADDSVIIHRREDQRPISQLDLIRRNALAESGANALLAVQESNDLTRNPLARVALDLVADAEAEALHQFQELFPLLFDLLGRQNACAEPIVELIPVEVLADEDELVLTRLVGAPRLIEGRVIDHVHRLVDVTIWSSSDVQNPFHAVNVVAPLSQNEAHEILHFVQVELPGSRDADAAHRGIVLMLSVRVQELRVHL
mmetsp:Transcript_91087/g.257346  ORF Transcript_91087/g.257346 Transcript_91087/m.257346 type:complete len:202 (-) Transcript_91087:764-1369(-)